MKKNLPYILVFIFIHFNLFGQRDDAGSGRAIQFDAVDDYIDLGNIYDNLQLPITISAWVYSEPSTEYILPIFASQDNTPLYNGFWFCLSATNLFIEYGDGRGENNSSFRRGKSAAVTNLQNRWIYVAAVLTSATNIQLYANGFNIGGAYTGNSNAPMASNYPEDVAKIGYLFTNSVTHNFKGMIDELRIWNRSLTEHEVRESMCRRLKGDEVGLIGYWNFDETGGEVLMDLTTNGFNGTLKGNPTRVFSGAPVGDESVFLYTSDWTSKDLSNNDISVTNVSGNPYGAHIYQVNHIPSQTDGLHAVDLQPPYYGVFLADGALDNTFDFSFTTPDPVCNVYQRTENSIPEWSLSQVFSGIEERIEIIPVQGDGSLEVNLGPDVTLCNAATYSLEAHADTSGKTFLWSTGETTSSISVTTSGEFFVKVTDRCETKRDTIRVSFLNTPPDFSLGNDKLLCTIEPQTLAVDLQTRDYDFLWQDGSRDSTMVVNAFGTYWVEIKNICGSSRDSIIFTQKQPPAAVSLGEDLALCSFEPIILAVDTETNGAHITWQDGSSKKSFLAHEFGTYWVRVDNGCGVVTDSITFTQKVLQPAPQYNFLSPGNEDTLNEYFSLDKDLAGFILNVYNRWGKPVYQSPSYNDDWNGSDLPAGVYFYTIDGPCIEQYKGTITIMR
jgi:hypothetical protein